jgi:hypothetical protein
MTTGRNAPCPCGSGKKFKKCHRSGDDSPRARMHPDVAAVLNRAGARPGCHLSEEFTKLERRLHGGALEDYARHVLTRTATEPDIERSRESIRIVVDALLTNCPPTDFHRRCKDTGMALVGMLERAGVWCFAVQGSVRVSFAAELGLTDRFLWTRDQIRDTADPFMGHMWIVAPPFALVDVTAKFQGWQNDEGRYIPSPLLEKDPRRCAPSSALFANPDLEFSGHFPESLQALWKDFPPTLVRTSKATITYQPDGISLPDLSLEGISSITLAGRTPLDFFSDLVAPRLSP